VKTRLERLADAVADLASHRAALPAAVLLWWAAGWSAVDGLQLLLTFAVLNVQARGDRATHVKLDSLVRHSDAPNIAIEIERAGEEDIERAREGESGDPDDSWAREDEP
jgi:low affinity Fe/Cu permease